MSIHTQSIETLITHVPAIATTAPHSSCSPRYAMVNSRNIADHMFSMGWQLVGGKQARSRKPENRQFARHSMLFTRPDFLIPELNATAYTQIINAHAGNVSLQVWGGIFKFACANELLSGEVFDVKTRMRHSGSVLDSLTNSLSQISMAIPRLISSLNSWKRFKCTASDAESIAVAGLAARFGWDSSVWPTDPSTMVSGIRRSDDFGNDLWLVVNRVQENILRPEHLGRINEQTGKRIPFRRVTAFDRLSKVNSAIWNAADRLVGLAA